MYPQIENVIPRNAILFLPYVLRRLERIAYGKLDVVLLRDPKFRFRLSAKFDVCKKSNRRNTRARGATPPLMVIVFALEPLSVPASGEIMKEAKYAHIPLTGSVVCAIADDEDE